MNTDFHSSQLFELLYAKNYKKNLQQNKLGKEGHYITPGLHCKKAQV